MRLCVSVNRPIETQFTSVLFTPLVHIQFALHSNTIVKPIFTWSRKNTTNNNIT